MRPYAHHAHRTVHRLDEKAILISARNDILARIAHGFLRCRLLRCSIAGVYLCVPCTVCDAAEEQRFSFQPNGRGLLLRAVLTKQLRLTLCRIICHQRLFDRLACNRYMSAVRTVPRFFRTARKHRIGGKNGCGSCDGNSRIHCVLSHLHRPSLPQRIVPTQNSATRPCSISKVRPTLLSPSTR